MVRKEPGTSGKTIMKSLTSLRELIKQRGFVVGSWINSASPIIAEIMAYSGFDFLTVDAEHSSVDIYQTQLMFQAIQAGNQNCHPLVRLPSNEGAIIKKYMDAGAAGVIAPMVNTREIAEEVVSAVKYPPLGTRGVGYSRSNQYGAEFSDAVATDNEKTFVCAQIEHIEGVENLEEILSVKGLDAVLIGPYDLSASMGITGELEHPELKKVQRQILTTCQEFQVVPGIHVVKPNREELRQRLDEGYQFLPFSLDITIISEASKDLLQLIKNEQKIEGD
jgi:2-dehydro-3-deoxyglucarate aldolase